MPERPLEDTDKEREEGYYPPRFDFIFRFCAAKGLILRSKETICELPMRSKNAGKPDFFKIKELFQFWQDHYMTSSAEAVVASPAFTGAARQMADNDIR